ncbi:MAG: response regulator [Alphaproteobacteria bacterium]|nr:response regulator [Alphaproteobacteria bacterium]
MEKQRDAASILIADDEKNICFAMQFLLEGQGYDVTCVEDGAQAIDALQSSQPQLLLLDLTMPKLNGYEVCQAARADPRLGAMRILIVSAQCKDVAVEKAMAMGADGYLKKPFSSADVISAVGTLLNGSPSEGQH